MPLSGGCINYSFKIFSTHGNYFLKYNNKDRYPKMFESEAAGLLFLQHANALKIPEVMGCGESENFTFIILEFVESGARKKNFFFEFGIQLAKLHRTTHDEFGFKENNYIGSLPQSNSWKKNGIDFFIEERLMPQCKQAYDKKYFDRTILKHFESLYNKLPEILPAEKPALLHGDLWNGNFLITTDGLPCLIDPSEYFGFREQDIAMTKLFGGFDNNFYNGYNSAFAMEKGWQHRIDIFNLYPLLVHVNLFGQAYIGQVNSIIKKY